MYFRIVLIFTLFICMAVGVVAESAGAAVSKGRVLYVGKNSRPEWNGLTPDRPLGSIGAAVKAARSGDEIRIAPGDYVESIRVGASSLTFRGAYDQDNVPLVRIFAPTDKSVVLADSGNSIWHGVSFHAGKAPVAELRDFRGRFEHCLFEMRDLMAMLNIYGGNPFFEACTFVGHPGPEAALHVDAPRNAPYQPSKKAVKYREYKGGGQQRKPASVTFVYCLFKDLGGGAVFLKNEQTLEFTNCLFANHRYAVMRLERIQAEISMVNSVFYLGSSERQVWQRPGDPKAKLENCLYAPGPDLMLTWQAKPLEEQPELECVNCVTASPRFSGGRQALINFGIDDTANVPHWAILAGHAEKLRQTITISLNTDALDEDFWKALIPAVARGHEVASHGAAHATLIAKEALLLSHYPEGASSATLTIDKDKKLIIKTDGAVVTEIPLKIKPKESSASRSVAPSGVTAGKTTSAKPVLDNPTRPVEWFTLGELVRRLQESGFKADLTDLSFRNVPAMLLASVDERDIFFEAYAPNFIFDGDAYRHYMLAESKSIIERGLAERKVAKAITALVCPYSEDGPDLVKAMDDTGFVIARARGDVMFTPAVERVNLYWLWSASLKDIIAYMPLDDREEMFRLIFDFMKYHGAIIGLYSHGGHEFNIQDWGELFSLTAKEPLARVAGLAEIAEEVKRHCERMEHGIYRCPENEGPVRGKVSFIPGPESPLINAGRSTPYGHNFYGQPIKSNTSPNIGIF